MFQTFTGSSRRPRQVNLSGRNPNPFAAAAGGSTSTAGSQNALVNAQQEREKRQRERERQQAAKTIQKNWRGAACRKSVAHRLRQQYDEVQEQGLEFDTELEKEQLRRLVQFFEARNDTDINRLRRFAVRHIQDVQEKRIDASGGPWPALYLRLETITLAACERAIAQQQILEVDNSILFESLSCLAAVGPAQDRKRSTRYYQTIRAATDAYILALESSGQSRVRLPTPPLVAATIAPLQRLTARTIESYEAFACRYLTSPELTKDIYLHSFLPSIASGVNYKLLARAMAGVLRGDDAWGYKAALQDANAQLPALSLFIYFHRHAHSFSSGPYTSEHDFISVVSTLLGSLADEVDIEAPISGDFDDEQSSRSRSGRIRIENQFIVEQLRSLVDREKVGSLLQSVGSDESGGNSADSARQLAIYALALLRFFPRQADEIRMWLFRGSSGSSTPAIKYFWNALRDTKVFRAISKDSKAAISLLKQQGTVNGIQYQPPSAAGAIEGVADDWRIILVFLELYTFVLKVMDDNEFFSASDPASDVNSAQGGSVQSNALPLDAIRDLTLFLKNLGFTMYFDAAALMATEQPNMSSEGLSSYFRISQANQGLTEVSKTEKAVAIPSVAGIAGMTMEYMKLLVTGILRMIYERDSRRRFLSKDHWLLTTRFEMDSFIPAVVSEEESRNAVRAEEDDGADEDDHDDDDNDDDARHGLVGNTRVRQTQYQQRLERQQRRLSRKRYLQAVAPRLELLQNMPFVFPFETRVQIFREFVHMDKIRRRQGFVDADTWRMFIANEDRARDRLAAHSATVKRGREFEDAFGELYELKDRLKEPISITFVDKFGETEAGIDGGGVTKEFLTSVTGQAFGEPIHGVRMFVENEQHLLYPNPTALEEKREALKQTGVPESDPNFGLWMHELLQQYEFLGRVIGKCLYEGILVDINFAGFFLRKWALTGGEGNSPNESGYRANINDLRELDEVLYQNLLKLKNYPGNVEDFSVDFTIADTVRLGDGTEKTITKDLIPNGSNELVTNANRLLYINYVAQHRLSRQPWRQTMAFLRGLASMIQPSWLSMFNQSELQTLIGGTSSQISIADLKANTQYGGVYQIGDDGLLHPTIEHFWRVMEGLEDGERRAVLKFVTSTPNAPLLGFGSLNPKFSIRDSGDDQSRLPSTSTCVNLLKLPRYASADILKERLLYAAFSGAGFDLS